MNLKLKPLVASISLALVSGSALAASYAAPAPAPQPVVERLDAALARNHNGRFAEPDWFRRITLSGEINVDALWSDATPTDEFRFGDSSPGSNQDEDYTDIMLSDANLYLGAKINDWVMANLDVTYQSDQALYNIHNHNHRNNVVGVGQQRVDVGGNFNVDEAYVTIANLRQSPFYVRLGEEYVPYGYYQRHPITQTLVQQLTQNRAVAAQVGFVDMSGFNGSLYVYRDTDSRPGADNDGHRTIETVGAQVGYRYEQGDMGFMADVSWLSNITDVDYLAGLIGSNFDDRVDGVSFVINGHYQGFDAEFQYTTALDKFAEADLSDVAGSGSEPEAWYLGVGYSFPTMGHDSRIGINYQESDEASFGNSNGVGAGLPEERWQVDYSVNLWRNTDLAFEYVNDDDYSKGDGGSGDDSQTVLARFSAKFA